MGHPQVPLDETCPEVFWEPGGGEGGGVHTYRTLGVGKVDLQVAHGLDDGHDGLNGVAVDNRTILPAFFL